MIHAARAQPRLVHDIAMSKCRKGSAQVEASCDVGQMHALAPQFERLGAGLNISMGTVLRLPKEAKAGPRMIRLQNACLFSMRSAPRHSQRRVACKMRQKYGPRHRTDSERCPITSERSTRPTWSPSRDVLTSPGCVTELPRRRRLLRGGRGTAKAAHENTKAVKPDMGNATMPPFRSKATT